MPTDELRQDAERFLMNTYARAPISIVRGRGSRVYDLEGREYLDFVAGIAVNTLGYSHPDLVPASHNQPITLFNPQTSISPDPMVRWPKPRLTPHSPRKASFCTCD